jgi:ubiquinone/menaquinone biosynthesis C-methylase UbiE
MKLRNLLALASRPGQVMSAFRGMIDQGVASDRQHLNWVGDAVLRYGRNSRDGGYAVSYSLIHGWAHGYVETTGYLVPTMLDLAQALDRPELRESALAQGPWLLGHQRADGSFPDINRQVSAAFDTGQVLLGLQRLHVETGEARYAEAARRACDYLAGLSEPDGSWLKAGESPGRSPPYYSRCAAAMMDFGKLVGEPRYLLAGEAFLNWAAGQQLPSGLFRHSELVVGRPYLLHTIIYVLEGFLHAYEVTGDRRWLDVVLKGAEPLKQANLTREIVLVSYYDADLKPASREKCITGLSQWANLALRLYELTGDEGYLTCASNSLFYLKSKQIKADPVIGGALPGSVPFWGDYLKLAFPNWNLKFFGDALLRWTRMGLDTSLQQERFVMSCHAQNAAKVGWTDVEDHLSAFDEFTLQQIEPLIAGLGGTPTVLDLGCGAGRCLDWFAARHPAWRLVGVDPIDPERPDRDIQVGTANRIPLGDASVEAVYATIALQHVGDIDGALAEIGRVLKPGGLLAVFDRNPVSVRGLLKPWHEIKGRWIYSWDAPFRERWYTAGHWRGLMRKAGFRTAKVKGYTDNGGRGWRGRLPINRFLLIAARKPA